MDSSCVDQGLCSCRLSDRLAETDNQLKAAQQQRPFLAEESNTYVSGRLDASVCVAFVDEGWRRREECGEERQWLREQE